MALKGGSTFFTNRACEYFPCHEGVCPDDFNCLFCFCPLYALGPECGGVFTYTEDGVKSCAACALVHVGEEGIAMMEAHFHDLADLARRRSGHRGAEAGLCGRPEEGF